MPYVIKHKTQDKFYPSSVSKKSRDTADQHGFVDLDFARIFPTVAGANTALTNWATKLIRGSISVPDYDKREMVEIVRVDLVLSYESH